MRLHHVNLPHLPAIRLPAMAMMMMMIEAVWIGAGQVCVTEAGPMVIAEALVHNTLQMRNSAGPMVIAEAPVHNTLQMRNSVGAGSGLHSGLDLMGGNGTIVELTKVCLSLPLLRASMP